MKIRTRRMLLGFTTTTIVTTWLFVGVFRDREFSTVYLFTKHRPSLKAFFFAPLGESENRIEDLSPQLRNEERAFREFVYYGGGYYRRIRLWD